MAFLPRPAMARRDRGCSGPHLTGGGPSLQVRSWDYRGRNLLKNGHGLRQVRSWDQLGPGDALPGTAISSQSRKFAPVEFLPSVRPEST